MYLHIFQNIFNRLYAITYNICLFNKQFLKSYIANNIIDGLHLVKYLEYGTFAKKTKLSKKLYPNFKTLCNVLRFFMNYVLHINLIQSFPDSSRTIINYSNPINLYEKIATIIPFSILFNFT